MWCVVVCDLETTKILVNEEETKAHWGGGAVAPRERERENTQTPGNYPKETVLHLQHGENPNLKSRKKISSQYNYYNSNKGLLKECYKEENVAVTGADTVPV
jgi:hypothetical protein